MDGGWVSKVVLGGFLCAVLSLAEGRPAVAIDCVAFFPSTGKSCPDGDAENRATAIGWAFCSRSLLLADPLQAASEAASRGESTFSFEGNLFFGVAAFENSSIADFAALMLDEMEAEKQLQVTSEANNRPVSLAPGQSKTETFICFDPDELEGFLNQLMARAQANAAN